MVLTVHYQKATATDECKAVNCKAGLCSYTAVQKSYSSYRKYPAEYLVYEKAGEEAAAKYADSKMVSFVAT